MTLLPISMLYPYCIYIRFSREMLNKVEFKHEQRATCKAKHIFELRGKVAIYSSGVL